MTLPHRNPQFPTETAARQASEALDALRGLLPATRGATVQLSAEGEGARVEAIMPRAALELLLDMLAQMACGNAVSIVPTHAELTTQEAADLLNVSRPHLVELLERGDIPFRKVGSHRRVRAEDLFAYKRVDDKRRAAIAAELTRDAEDLELGY